MGPDDALLTARDWMLAHGIDQLPVIRAGLVAGVLTNRDLLLLERQSRDTPTRWRDTRCRPR